MSLRIWDNIHKQGYAPGENRGDLMVLCPAYCKKCGRLFMQKICTADTCKNCEGKK